MDRSIETGRLIIREFRPEDLSDLYEILGDGETMKNLEPAYTPESCEKFLIDFCIRRRGALACSLKEGGKVIGYLLFNSLEAGVYELGWIFNRRFWRQGYAFEACSRLVEYAFNELNARKLFAETIDNEISGGLMRKLGMELKSVLKNNSRDSSGRPADMYCYELRR